MSAPGKQKTLKISGSKLNSISSPDFHSKPHGSSSAGSDQASDLWDKESKTTVISSRTSNKDPNSPDKSEFITESVIWNSKTALGKISYPNLNLPTLLIVEIKVATKEKKDTVKSSRLRRLALQEYIEKALGKDSKGIALYLHASSQEISKLNGNGEGVQDMKSKSGPFNILVIPILGKGNEEEAQSIMSKLLRAQDEPLSAKEKYNQKDNKSEESFTCTVGNSCPVYNGGTDYLKYMNVLFRYAVRLSDPVYVEEDSIVIETVKSDLPYPYSVGVRAKIESSQTSLLALAFDLAVVIDSEINVLELVKSQHVLNGASGLDKKVRDFLRGLYVKKIGQGTGEGPTRIRDVKSSTEMGPIQFTGEKQPITMRQYLRKHEKDFNEDTQQLLLADVGTNKPFWIALEFLNIVANQTVRGSGHLTPKLQHLRQAIQSKTKLKNWLFPYGTRFLKPLSDLGLLDADSINEHNNLEITQYVPVVVNKNIPVQKKEYMTEERPEQSSVGIIYFGKDHKVSATHDAIAGVRAALEEQDILPSKVIKTELFPSIKDILWSPDPDWMKEFKDCNVLIGVIDSPTDSDKLQGIESELHRFGERGIGALTVCVKKRTLGKFFTKPNSNAKFPSTILRKIKFMKGHRIFKDIPIERYLAGADYPDPLIIVGAHIMHSTGEESTVKYPSVSALVTNTNSQCPIHFLASSSLEPDSLPITISHLRERLEEQFKAWGNHNPAVTGSPRVVFYRLSNHSDKENDAVYEHEHEEINKAYCNVFKGAQSAPLTYIQVSKTVPGALEVNSKSIFTLVNGNHANAYATCDPSGKFQYDVKQDTELQGPSLGIEKLRNLTINLNNSMQLGGCPTIALPIHYAQLLNRRVLSYCDSISGKDCTVVPPAANRIKLPATGETPDRTRMYVEKFWKFDHKWDYIRLDTEEKRKNPEPYQLEMALHPWKPALDNTMFYI
ncbi:hypothetical protein DM02DRAFT_724181 [Periconia macrospinosa]|uniref:Piwi domain-containing protein n=1 Tax=Periconia macrospinosa TaxID=97972 RepID=A0A2V1EA27_9PLEO|nr:hypothetical protein DM02DRAFT_724181 [Periconia macrospinosa]